MFDQLLLIDHGSTPFLFVAHRQYLAHQRSFSHSSYLCHSFLVRSTAAAPEIDEGRHDLLLIFLWFCYITCFYFQFALQWCKASGFSSPCYFITRLSWLQALNYLRSKAFFLVSHM